METQQQPPQQMSYQVQYVQPPTAEWGRISRHSIGIGVTLIALGVLSIVANVVGITVTLRPSAMFFFVGHGIWGGVLYILAGSFGSAAAAYKNKCLTIAFMVLAIIAAAQSLSLLILAIVGVSVSPCSRQNYYRYSYYYPECTKNDKVALGMECLLVICAFVGGILCIVGSAFACKASCCCSQTPAPTILFAPYAGQPVILNPWQQQQQQQQQLRQPVPLDIAPPMYTLPQWPAAASGIAPGMMGEPLHQNTADYERAGSDGKNVV